MNNNKSASTKEAYRVCIVRHAYYPQDVRVRKEVRALIEAGYFVDVICLRSKGQSKHENVDGAFVYRLGTEHQRGSLFIYILEYALGFIKMFFLLTYLFGRKRYQCIQVNTLPDALVFITIVPYLFGAKVLLDMHEPAPELFIAKFGENRFRWAVKLIAFVEQCSMRYATAVLAVNETIRQRYIERGAEGKKIFIVRNVPEIDASPVESLTPNSNRFSLLLHGLIAERYGHEMTVKAISKIKHEIPNIHLNIAGSGENENRVRQIVKDLDLSSYVTFLGWVSIEQIHSLIASTDIGLVPLLPSSFADLCQPNKLFDLVSGKRAVVASRLKAIEENFDDSCIAYFEPGNIEDLARCILDLYQNPAKRCIKAENAYRKYNLIKWEHSKFEYINIVNEMMAIN